MCPSLFFVLEPLSAAWHLAVSSPSGPPRATLFPGFVHRVQRKFAFPASSSSFLPSVTYSSADCSLAWPPSQGGTRGLLGEAAVSQ